MLDLVCQPKQLWALRVGINKSVQNKTYIAFPNYPKLKQEGFFFVADPLGNKVSVGMQ